MNEYRPILERLGESFSAPDLTLDRVLRRRDRLRQGRRIAAGIVGVGIAIAVAIGGATLLRSAPTPAVDEPQLSPVLHANGRIVVSQGLRGIWILDPDDPTAEPELLVADRELPNVGLAWSPDGTRLAYAVAERHRRRPWTPSFGVWVLDLATGRSEQISTCSPSGCPERIDWSPDGTHLAVTDRSTLYLMDLEGDRGPTLATAGFDDEMGQPSWSPDGSRIVYSVRVGSFPDYGPSQLFTIAPDGTDQRLLLERAFNGAMDPDWSPDGSRIAYWDWGTDEAYDPTTAPEASLPKVWVVDADGTDATPVFIDRSGTVGPGSDFGGVSWSPDGEQIAFVLAYDFYLVDADGTNVRRERDLFPRNLGFALRPAWQPIPESS
jgi:Tol biopolymer transport system component